MANECADKALFWTEKAKLELECGTELGAKKSQYLATLELANIEAAKCKSANLNRSTVRESRLFNPASADAI